MAGAAAKQICTAGKYHVHRKAIYFRYHLAVIVLLVNTVVYGECLKSVNKLLLLGGY